MNSRFTLTIFALALLVAACAPVATNTNTTGNTTLPNMSEVPTEVPVETNEPVEEDFAAELTFTEGDLIELKTLAVDPDNDDVELEFSRPFDTDGTWQTEIGDAGDYPVTVVARDARGAEVEQHILVTILFANRAPVIEGVDSITVKEGDTIELDFAATDADEDEVLISYSGWMKGHTYTTTHDDAGEHTVVVIAEDGKTETRKNVTVTVENVNRAPAILTNADEYELVEGQTLSLKPKAEDADGDSVTIEFGEPLNEEGTWTTELGDAGEYTVELSASDGTDTTVKEVLVNVLRANRAPTLATPSGDNKLYVKEGDRIDLRNQLIFADEEDEDITATYAGWMSGPTYQTTYDDAGEHLVTVTLTDASNHTVRQGIVVVVADVNRPPVFVRPA